jgi:hypothetical protein
MFRLPCLIASILFSSVAILAAEPDIPIPARSFPSEQRIISDQKTGSVLIYNFYTSAAQDAKTEDTTISMTNTHPDKAVAMHVFFIADSCTTADAFICLAGTQTATFNASDVDPGIKGYLIAIATDAATGCPISFNHLIGDETIKLASGHVADLAAIGVSALYQGTFPGCRPNTAEVTLRFDNVQYNALPRVLAASHLRSPLDGDTNFLIVNGIGGSLAVGTAAIGQLTGNVYNDATVKAGFMINTGCQFRGSVSVIPLSPITINLATLIPAGRTGWLSASSARGTTITGALLNFNPKAAETRGARIGGHNLHQLSYTNTTLLVPVFPASC